MFLQIHSNNLIKQQWEKTTLWNWNYNKSNEWETYQRWYDLINPYKKNVQNYNKFWCKNKKKRSHTRNSNIYFHSRFCDNKPIVKLDTGKIICFIDAVSRIHTSKIIVISSAEYFEAFKRSEPCNKCRRLTKWLDSRLLDVKLEKGNAIESSSGYVDCFPLLLLHRASTRRMPCRREESRPSWCFKTSVSMDYLFCRFDMHLYLN